MKNIADIINSNFNRVITIKDAPSESIANALAKTWAKELDSREIEYTSSEIIREIRRRYLPADEGSEVNPKGSIRASYNSWGKAEALTVTPSGDAFMICGARVKRCTLTSFYKEAPDFDYTRGDTYPAGVWSDAPAVKAVIRYR